jgi:1-acyl-sn-glycerol-3-phosphate acyltransferase
MKRLIYQFIFYRLMRWKIEGDIPADIKKCVLLVMPHTSWLDFIIGLLARGIIGMEMHWVGKKELFRFPFGTYFRWMGGTPLDRSGNKNLVDSIVKIFQNKEIFRMAIAPEGTRKKVIALKSGFYYIAHNANVPVIPVAFDYKTKIVKIGKPFHVSGNYEEDLKIITLFYKGVLGKIPKFTFDF